MTEIGHDEETNAIAINLIGQVFTGPVGRHPVIVSGSEIRMFRSVTSHESVATYRFSPGLCGMYTATLIVNADLTLVLELHVSLAP